MSDQINRDVPTEQTDNASARSRTGFFSTAHSSEGMLTDQISTGSVVDDPKSATGQKDPELPWLRINWDRQRVAGRDVVVPVGDALLA
jgi:hypothetical protein